MEKREILVALILVLIAVLFRTLWHVGPNFELVTAVSIVAGYSLKNIKLAMMVPLVTMMISDSILGNSIIFLFTWSAYILAPLIAKLSAKFIYNNNSFLKSIFFIEGSALLFVIVFFLWTNFGVVVVTNMYSKDIVGLITSYINGLPFIKPQLFSAIITTPIVFGLVEFILKSLNNVNHLSDTRELKVNQLAAK